MSGSATLCKQTSCGSGTLNLGDLSFPVSYYLQNLTLGSRLLAIVEFADQQCLRFYSDTYRTEQVNQLLSNLISTFTGDVKQRLRTYYLDFTPTRTDNHGMSYWEDVYPDWIRQGMTRVDLKLRFYRTLVRPCLEVHEPMGRWGLREPRLMVLEPASLEVVGHLPEYLNGLRQTVLKRINGDDND